MISHALDFVDTIEFHVGSKNIRSQKALAKMGIKDFHTVEIKNEKGLIQKILVYQIHKGFQSLELKNLVMINS